MPHGVYVFQVIEDKHIDPSWVRGVLGVSQQRYSRLKTGRVLFKQEEVERLVGAMRETYNIGRQRLFSRDAEILPPNRHRRAKGTVRRTEAA